MAVIVNNPSQPRNSSNSWIGLIVVLILVILLLIYGLPALRSGFAGRGAQINVPDKINVNIQQPGTQAK